VRELWNQPEFYGPTRHSPKDKVRLNGVRQVNDGLRIRPAMAEVSLAQAAT
jgi:hypothetical protein